MTIWYSADAHFYHTNILKYCNRPFKSVKHMNDEIVRRWNSVVEPDDTVFYLGDVGYWINDSITSKVKEIYDTLNGNKILVSGNHDHKTNGIASPIQNMDIEINGWLIHCSHVPNPIYKMNFSGHVHEKYDVITPGGKTIVNVGVDVWDFYPTNIEKINARLEEKGLRKIE